MLIITFPTKPWGRGFGSQPEGPLCGHKLSVIITKYWESCRRESSIISSSFLRHPLHFTFTVLFIFDTSRVQPVLFRDKCGTACAVQGHVCQHVLFRDTCGTACAVQRHVCHNTCRSGTHVSQPVLFRDTLPILYSKCFFFKTLTPCVCIYLSFKYVDKIYVIYVLRSSTIEGQYSWFYHHQKLQVDYKWVNEIKIPFERDNSPSSLVNCCGGQIMLFSVRQSLEVTYRMSYIFNKFLLFTEYSLVLQNLVLRCVNRNL